MPHRDAAAGRLFLYLSLVRSRPPEQAKKQTDSLQTRMNTGLQLLNVQEGSREQREKSGRMHAWNDDFGRVVLKRARLGAAPILALRPKKIPADKGWDHCTWWCNHTLGHNSLSGHVSTGASSCGPLHVGFYRFWLASSIACISAACSHLTTLQPLATRAGGRFAGGLSPA